MTINPSQISDYITIKQNDTSRILYDTLYVNSAVLNLSASTVKLNLYNLATSTNAQYTATVITPASGSVSLTFPSTEVATTGSYLAEWAVTFSDSTQLSIPSEGWILIRVIDDLD